MKLDALEREIERYQIRTPHARKLDLQAKKFLPGGSSRGTAYFDPVPHLRRPRQGALSVRR